MSEDGITFDQGLLDYLGQYITPHKKSVMERVLAKRTRHLTVVLEDIFKPHNASAVILRPDRYIVGVARSGADLDRISQYLPVAP